MDDGLGPDQYEEQLKEVFDSFDCGGSATLNLEELSALCQSLQLDHSALLHALLQNQDHDQLPSRVDFNQFKDALIQVLSSAAEPPAEQQHKPSPEPVSDSPEIQPKFVKGSKCYGRRSTPEFLEEQMLGSSEVTQRAAEEDFQDNDDLGVPRKRERWNAHESCSEEYEAEGQLHLWNPDEPSTPRRSAAPLPSHLEEKLREACEELRITWDGCAAHSELLALCEHSGLEINKDVLFSLTGDAVMNVQEFVSRVLNQNKPPTPSASTPYRQLKRHHSTQPFDEGGRRIATTSALTSTIGMRLFSTLDDGSGFTPAESILDAWIEEGIENSTEILQALNFDLEGKVSLCELTSALENELLVTKNGIQQAAVASFRAEIRHLLERMDREIREKEKIRSDLEKTEKLKTRLAAEVDEHHSAIELMNNLNLRKLEQNQREKLAAVRSDLMKEMDLIQQQAGLQRDQMEAEIDKIREDESFLRDHLSISVKENRRLERELLDSSEKLLEAHNQISKVEANMDSIMKDKFGDLDPGTADFLLQEERIKQLHSSYEAQCRELQDRIDELQSELRDLHSLGRTHQPGHKPLSEELESKSPGMESDPGIGSEEVQPFSMTLEVEMMLERLKEQHLQEMEDLRKELESKVDEFDLSVEKQRVSHDLQLVAMALQHRQEVQALREEMTAMQSHQQELQNQLQQAVLERTEQVQNLQLQLQDADTHAADLQEQLRTLEVQQAETEEDLPSELEELRERHAAEVKKMKGEHSELLEEIKDLTEEKEELQRRLLDDWEREKKPLEESHEDKLGAKLEEAAGKFEAERDETVRRLTAEWQKEKTRLDEQNNESLQLLLEEEMLRLVREQEEKEDRLREQWEGERGRLQEHQEALLHRVLEERLTLQEQFDERENRLKEEWEREKLQLEEDYEGMVQDRLQEQREKMEEQREEMEEQKEKMEEQRKNMEEEREKMEEQKEKMGAEREEMEAEMEEQREKMEAEKEEMEEQREKMEAEMEEQREKLEAEREAMEEQKEKMEEQRELMMNTVEEVKAEERARLEENHREAMKELSMKHCEERDTLSASLDRLRDDIAQERQDIEVSFNQRIREVEDRFSGDQESVAKRFQADVLKLEQHYQSELRALADSHRAQELQWKARTKAVQESGEQQREEMEEALRRQADWLRQEWTGETQQLEAIHREEVEALAAVNKQLHAELEELTGRAQTKEIELSRQLNDLHGRLQESLNGEQELLARSESRALATELLLNQTVEDFEQEREELLGNTSQLEERYSEVFSVCERQSAERVKLLAERDHLKMKVEEVEMVLQQAALDFELERQELQEHLSILEDKLKDHRENDEEELGAERKELQIKEVEVQRLQRCGDEFGGRSPEEEEPCDEGCEVTRCDHADPEPQNQQREAVASLEAFGDGGKRDVLVSREEVDKPQEHASHEDKQHHETAVVSPEETGDGGGLTMEDHCTQEVGSDRGDEEECPPDEECSAQAGYLLNAPPLQENVLLQEKNELLQQKTELLENLLAHNAEKLKTGQQVLEENYGLKVKMLLLMEHLKTLETKVLKMTELQIRYEDCICENSKLKEQNGELERRMWSLEGGVDVMDVFQHLHGDQVSLVDEISQLRDQNTKLSELFQELDLPDGAQPEHMEGLGDEVSLDLDRLLEAKEREASDPEAMERAASDPEAKERAASDPEAKERAASDPEAKERAASDPEAKERAVSDLEDVCREFEKQNVKLRQAITELQDRSQSLNETTQAHGSEASRLAEENVNLRQKIAALKEEELKEIQEELIQTLDHLKEEKSSAQKAAVCFQKQISDLRLHSRQLLDENGMLTESNALNAADTERLRLSLSELMERREAFPAEERNKLAACVSALEAELTRALEDTAQLEERNIQLSQQLCDLRQKAVVVETMESQLSHIVEERKSADKEAAGLRSQLAKAQERVRRLKEYNQENHILEKALHSSGLQHQSKKLYRDEMSRLMEKEQQQLLQQENERLQAELRSITGSLVQSREKVRQLDATVLSLKQQQHQSQALLLKALEQENAALKQELEAQRELTKGCEAGQRHSELDSLQQENEALKTQMARMSSQLLETIQAQLVGLLPPSPHRLPRGGPHRGEEPDNLQDEREKKMKNMEERMKEIELSLRNVKLLLREKVAQLKDQLHKNGKADVLIGNLYVENAQLLKSLEITEQRQKITEKKNHLLEEKISTLNKIVRDLSPSPLPSLPYHF